MFGEPATDEQELELRPLHNVHEGEVPDEGAPDEPSPGVEEAPTQAEQAEVGPHLLQPARPSPDYSPEEERLWRSQREFQEQSERETAIERVGERVPQPSRARVDYHVFVTERRGNERWSHRTILVPATTPVQILGLDENRRRALIIVAMATADGYFVAFGSEQLSPFTTNYAAGALGVIPELGRSTVLVPVGAASSVNPVGQQYLVEHVRDVWAIFVPDSNLTNKGQSALISISAEYGESSLAERRRQPLGAQVDR